MLDGIVLGAVSTILSLWLGSSEYRMRELSKKFEEIFSKKDTEQLIDLKQESIKAIQAEIKEDIQRLETKIDRLLNRST